MWALRASSPSLEAFEHASHFAVNVLAHGQIELSRRFASPVHDRFAEGEWSEGRGHAPVLADCAAVFECVREKQMEAGDHVLFVGRVQRLVDSAVGPLVFQSGHYHQLSKLA
jgi:3-hydroxy-9,10-secoandrosta-1,3,5(10)-triene-9,17-dione monooxygenase reductase component